MVYNRRSPPYPLSHLPLASAQVQIEEEGDERPAGDVRLDAKDASRLSGSQGQGLKEEEGGGGGDHTPPSSGEPEAPVMSVRGHGGSSGRYSTTYVGPGVEWSATGRKGVSLAELSGLHDAGFSFERAISRLIEMMSREYMDRWGGRGPRFDRWSHEPGPS